jgi:phosphoglycolate phosphatase
MRFKCLIFDLDGTLVDTIRDIGTSMNHALEGRGFPPFPLEDYHRIVGWGVKKLASLALPPAARDEKTIEAVTADHISYYTAHPLVSSKPYSGIPELMTQLRAKNIKTAVLSNKPDPITQLVVGGLFPPAFFDLIRGDLPGVPRKPDPAATWDILTALDSSPRETLFVGDSEIDIETARAAECSSLGVSWGFRGRAVLEAAGAGRIIDTPGEILDLLAIRY